MNDKYRALSWALNPTPHSILRTELDKVLSSQAIVNHKIVITNLRVKIENLEKL